MVSSMSCLSFIYGPFLFFAILLVPTSPHGELRQPEKHIAMFVFGDSVYDPGNNVFLNITYEAKANFPPYGETFFKNPTGRYCDGRIIPDFIAMDVKLPLWKPFLGPGPHQFINGANFATPGAPVLVETVAGFLGVRDQIRFYKNVASFLREKLGDEEATKILINAIYLSSLGGPDYMRFIGSYPNATESQMTEFVNLVIGNITNMLEEIYEIGGRKFAFQNVAPMGCMPELKQDYDLSADDCVEELLVLAKIHNNALSNAAKELESQLPGFKYSIFDLYNTLYDRIKNPTKYGFKVADMACCGRGTYRGYDCGIEPYELCSDPSEYVYFDGGHPTEAVNIQLSELWWKGEPNITIPINMKQLFELEPVIEISLEYDNRFIDE